MFDNLINQVIDKYKSLENSTDKIQVLTLAPDEWSIKTLTVAKFGASDYAVRRARYLKKTCGILATPRKKKGRTYCH